MGDVDLFLLKYNNHKGFNLTELSTMLERHLDNLPELIGFQYRSVMNPIKMIIGYIGNSQVVPEEWIYNKDGITITPSVKPFTGNRIEMKRKYKMCNTTIKVKSSDPILSRYRIGKYDSKGDTDSNYVVYGLIKKLDMNSI